MTASNNLPVFLAADESSSLGGTAYPFTRLLSQADYRWWWTDDSASDLPTHERLPSIGAQYSAYAGAVPVSTVGTISVSGSQRYPRRYGQIFYVGSSQTALAYGPLSAISNTDISVAKAALTGAGYVPDPSVAYFMAQNQIIIPIITEAPSVVRTYFGHDAQTLLELVQDPDESWHRLFIVIKSSLVPEAALRQEIELIENWFGPRNRKARGLLGLAEGPL